MLRNAKVGDSVYDAGLGWGIVVDVREKGPYPVCCEFTTSTDKLLVKEYAKDGRCWVYDNNPTCWTEKTAPDWVSPKPKRR